jgi:predicted secreted protein
LKKIAVLFATIMCFAMISGSFAAATNQNTYTNPILIQKSTLNVVLPSNPTTGYHWIATYNHEKVKLLSRTYTPFTPNICGSGGIETFKFIGIKGEKVTLKYVGPGIDKPVAETYVYYIK